MEELYFEAVKERNKALSMAQSEMDVAIADSSGARGSKYCSYESLERAAGPALRKYGFSVDFEPCYQDGIWMYVAILDHSSGAKPKKAAVPYIPDEGGSMSLVQGWGSGGRYAQRYSYEYVTGVVTSKEMADPDDKPYAPRPTAVPLSDDQVDKLEAFIEEHAQSPASFKERQLTFYKISSLKYLSEKQAQAMMSYLTKDN